MRKKIWGGLGTPVLALVLAIIVWVNATYQNDQPRQDEFTEAIPIEMLNQRQGLVPTNDPVLSVQITIKAFSSSWRTLTASAFSVTADWAGLDEGIHAVPLQATCSDPTVSILAVHPNTLYVRLERVKKELKEVTVALSDRDEVPLGYRVYSPEVEPGFVTIEGPSSIVDSVDRVAVSLSLLRQRTSIERVVEPLPVTEDGTIVSGLRLSPTAVTLRVAIEKKQNYRDVVVRARTAGQPARGYFLSGVNVSPATITIVGPPDTIDTMGGIVDTKGEIDMTGTTRMVAERPELDLPEGVSVLGAREGETFRVLVTVGVDAVTGGTTVELRLTSKRLREGLISQVAVPSVDVILTGPAVLLDELETDLLEAYVDLAGLDQGTHQIRPQVEILADQDSKLRDLVVKDISPKFVQVSISLPPTATSTASPTASPTLSPTPTQTATLTSTPLPTVTQTLNPTVTIAATVGVTSTATVGITSSETVELTQTPEQEVDATVPPSTTTPSRR